MSNLVEWDISWSPSDGTASGGFSQTNFIYRKPETDVVVLVLIFLPNCPVFLRQLYLEFLDQV